MSKTAVMTSLKDDVTIIISKQILESELHERTFLLPEEVQKKFSNMRLTNRVGLMFSYRAKAKPSLERVKILEHCFAVVGCCAVKMG